MTPDPTPPLGEAEHLAQLAEYFTEFADGRCHVHGLALVQMVVNHRAREAALRESLTHCVETIREWPQLHASGDYLHGWVLTQAEDALAATAAPPAKE